MRPNPNAIALRLFCVIMDIVNVGIGLCACQIVVSNLTRWVVLDVTTKWRSQTTFLYKQARGGEWDKFTCEKVQMVLSSMACIGGVGVESIKPLQNALETNNKQKDLMLQMVEISFLKL